MSLKEIMVLISLIAYSTWTIILYYRIFDKNFKKYIMGISSLLIFWFSIRVIRKYVDNNITWYLYYIPLIFMPTLYYIISKYLLNKASKVSSTILYSISTILVVLVLTNDLHTVVFSLRDTLTKEYSHKAGYFAIVLWILYLFIRATINLVIQRIRYKKDLKLVLPFVPIILGAIYTAMYVYLPGFGKNTDMTVILGFLIFIGVEQILRMNLIPHNIKYEKIFKNSYLNICIVSNNGELVYSTKNKTHVPSIILEDIKSHNSKEKYINPDNKNLVYEVKTVDNCYSIIQKDYSKIDNLKQELEIKNNELKEQEKILIKQKEIKDQLYEIKLQNEILENLESKIEDKRQRINNIIDNMNEPDKEKLKEVKILIAYCKRMSNLIISSHNEEYYNKEKLSLILNELLEDFKSNNINGVINIYENINLTSYETSNMYEILFLIFENIKDIGILVNINEKSIDILLDKKQDELFGKIKKYNKQLFKNINQKDSEDETLLSIEL